MAKNKNQNRQHEQHERSDQRAGQGMEPPERSSTMTEQHVMPAAPQSARKGQKKFGHN